MITRNVFVLVCIVIATTLGMQTAFAQQKRALLIGISDYGNVREDPDQWSNISGANDVKLLTPLFEEQGFAVTSLVDAEATHSAIIKALDKLTKRCKKGDLVYLHFSMHGQPVEDLDGDEKDGWDEALIPVDAQMRYQQGVYEGDKHLLDDTLEEYFNKIRSKLGTKGQLYVVLDACHSGTASRGDDDHVRGVRDGFTYSGKYYTPDRTRETNDYFRISTQPGQAPVTFIEACRSYQQNKEVRERETNTWYGSLSYYVAKAMQSHKLNQTNQWIDEVKTAMKNDRRLRRQNVVIESSK